jgi:hypothetical protein
VIAIYLVFIFTVLVSCIFCSTYFFGVFIMKVGKIEKKVPVPVVHSKIKYPWHDMKVGESVLIEAEEGDSLFNLKRKVGPAARYFGEKTGRAFKTLLMREENGVRVWRTK